MARGLRFASSIFDPLVWRTGSAGSDGRSAPSPPRYVVLEASSLAC
jgi:hypothetical protein